MLPQSQSAPPPTPFSDKLWMHIGPVSQYMEELGTRVLFGERNASTYFRYTLNRRFLEHVI